MRKNQKNLWVDAEFLNWLKRLKAKKTLEGIDIRNLGELTKEIINTDAIKEVENQVLRQVQGKSITNIKIKLDTNRLFR
jgi:hypothetical protein